MSVGLPYSWPLLTIMCEQIVGSKVDNKEIIGYGEFNLSNFSTLVAGTVLFNDSRAVQGEDYAK